MTAPVSPSALAPLLEAWSRHLAAGLSTDDAASALLAASRTTFREAVLEEMLRRPSEPAEGMAAEPGGAPPPPTPDLPLPTPTPEAAIIAREAQRAGIDPALLAALRRVENGRPGREFGVLSVAAPGIEEQARAAANSIRKTMARFERQGGTVVDASTGRYTEDFLRFFSARYAPLGAANDPLGLNRFHAANLIAQYRRVRGKDVGG